MHKHKHTYTHKHTHKHTHTHTHTHTHSHTHIHTHTHAHTHTHTHKHKHTLYILFFIRYIVHTSHIKCESLKPNFTFLVIIFTCLMWHIYQSFAVTSIAGY